MTDNDYRPPSPSKDNDALPRVTDSNAVEAPEMPEGILPGNSKSLRRSPSTVFDNNGARGR